MIGQRASPFSTRLTLAGCHKGLLSIDASKSEAVLTILNQTIPVNSCLMHQEGSLFVSAGIKICNRSRECSRSTLGASWSILMLP